MFNKFSQKFNTIGVDEFVVTQLINNINTFNSSMSADKNFSCSYVVEGVEIILSILAIIKESYNSLDQYLKDTFEYSLPVWIEAIIKIGQFLNFFQTNSSLEGILMKEVYDQLKLTEQYDNLVIIEGVKATIEDEVIRKELHNLLVTAKTRVVDELKDIQIIFDSETGTKAVVVLIDGFNIEDFKEETAAEPVAEVEEEFWQCYYCGNENDKENPICIFCDKNKKVKPKDQPKRKSTLIKTHSYQNNVNEKMQELMNSLKTKLLPSEQAEEVTEQITEIVASSESAVKKSTITVVQGEEAKKRQKLLNEFFKTRMDSYINEGEYLQSRIQSLESGSSRKYIASELELLKNLVKDTSPSKYDNINFVDMFNTLQNNGVDFWFENVVLDPMSRNNEIDINLMERIRELIDINICKEKGLSLKFPALSLRFIPQNFASVNHVTIEFLETYFKELRNVPLSVIRYYWVLIKYFNNCLAAALPFIKPPDVYSSDIKEASSDEFVSIPFPKTISAFLSSARGITFSTIKQNLIRDIISSTEFNEEEVQIPTMKFERLNIRSTIDSSNAKKGG